MNSYEFIMKKLELLKLNESKLYETKYKFNDKILLDNITIYDY